MNPPTPTVLKLAMGNPGKRPIVPDDFRPTGEPMKPKWLKGVASARWDDLAPQLIAAGVLTAIEADTFACYCALCAELAKSRGKMHSSRIAQMRALASEFGIGAASRTKIRLPKPGPKSNAAKYFAA